MVLGYHIRTGECEGPLDAAIGVPLRHSGVYVVASLVTRLHWWCKPALLIRSAVERRGLAEQAKGCVVI